MLRTIENAMPAVTTEIDWTIADVLSFMIQTRRIVPNTAEYEAAQSYLQCQTPENVEKFHLLRWTSVPGFDPAQPGLSENNPQWREQLPMSVKNDLQPYFSLHDQITNSLQLIRESNNGQLYIEAENALLMCQRVDLWCAGPTEVEYAIQHLYQLGRAKNNDRVVDYPRYISDFIPGSPDFVDA
jgi:hypothetical protein